MYATTSANHSLNISLYFPLPTLHIDGQVIEYETTWNSRNYRESEFRAIAERNSMIEHLIMMVNAKLIDYHYHHRREYEYSIDSGHYHGKVYAYDSKENTLEVLHDAIDYCDELFNTILREGWQKHLCYLKMASTLLHNAYALLSEKGDYCENS